MIYCATATVFLGEIHRNVVFHDTVSDIISKFAYMFVQENATNAMDMVMVWVNFCA